MKVKHFGMGEKKPELSDAQKDCKVSSVNLKQGLRKKQPQKKKGGKKIEKRNKTKQLFP